MTLKVRMEIPSLLDREPCPLCEANPAEYHQHAPGYPVIRGYCLKCQAATNEECERFNLNFENARRQKRKEIAGRQDGEKKHLYLRDYVYHVRARECYAEREGCPGPGTRGYRCNHCHVTQPGRDIYFDGQDIPFKILGPGRKIA
jgi:hypothetical protein